MNVTIIKHPELSFPEQNPIRMISQSGKKTIFLFQNAQRRQLQQESSALNSEKERNHQHQTVDINKFIQKRLDLLNIIRENPKTYAFNAVSRGQMEKRVKSNSPKNNGEFYQLHYEVLEKKTPFLAKIRKISGEKKKNEAKNSVNSENVKTPFTPRNQINEKENLKIKEENWEKMQEDVEKTNKSQGVCFKKQLQRKELFSDFIRIGMESPLSTSSKPRLKVSSPNFAKYISRKPVFPPKSSTQKDYDRSPEIHEKFNLDNAFLHCLIDIAKAKPRKLFNEEESSIKKIEAPPDFNLRQGFCKTHRVFNANVGCYSPKVARERPSPVQDRILKANEKMGFECFRDKNLEDKNCEKQKKKEDKEEKFDLNKMVREVEKEIKRERKCKMYGKKNEDSETTICSFIFA